MNKFWKWKNVKNKVLVQSDNIQDDKEVEVTERVLILNGEIASESWLDDEVTPDVFKDELNSGTGPITVWINSPGGDCIAAAQIYNMLIDYKGDVTVKIDGLAASAASVIAMAGNKILMSPVSMLMIHNPSTIAFGNRDDMTKCIEMLDAVKDSIMNAYEVKTKLRRSKISELMDNETWFDSKKAKELGFCDEIMTRNTFDDILDTEPFEFQKNVSEKNLKNKLEEKYLIKKKEAPVNDGIKSKELYERLDTIKKFI